VPVLPRPRGPALLHTPALRSADPAAAPVAARSLRGEGAGWGSGREEAWRPRPSEHARPQFPHPAILRPGGGRTAGTRGRSPMGGRRHLSCPSRWAPGRAPTAARRHQAGVRGTHRAPERGGPRGGGGRLLRVSLSHGPGTPRHSDRSQPRAPETERGGADARRRGARAGGGGGGGGAWAWLCSPAGCAPPRPPGPRAGQGSLCAPAGQRAPSRGAGCQSSPQVGAGTERARRGRWAPTWPLSPSYPA
jgi:hypothetical protein